MRSSLLLCAYASMAVGCAGNPPPDSGPPIVVEVRNNDFRDATVYAIREGERQRLGLVTGKTDESFSIPWRPNFALRLEVRFLGGGMCATRQILLEPGQRYVLDLQPDPRLNQDCRRRMG